MKKIILNKICFVYLIFTTSCNKYDNINNIASYPKSISENVIPADSYYYHDISTYSKSIYRSYGLGIVDVRKDWVDLPASFDSVRTFFDDNLAQYGYVVGLAARDWPVPEPPRRTPAKSIAAYVRDVPAEEGRIYRSVITIVYDPPTPATRSWEPTDTYYLIILSHGTLSAEQARALHP